MQLGINAMLIEDGYCWYALPDISMEQAVEEGEYIGSMVSRAKVATMRQKAIWPDKCHLAKGPGLACVLPRW